MKNKKELIEYIDFESLSEDYKLESGDISPEIHFKLEELLKHFIRLND
jgi:RNase P/RNase MRP subunit POP5